VFVTLDESFSEFETILETHNAMGLEAVDALGPIYAGGYPTALLLAPKTKHGNISSFYCDDIDVYGYNEEHIKHMIEGLDSIGQRIFESEHAISYSIPGVTRKVQVIRAKHFTSGVETTLGNYDLINCAVAFEPGVNQFTLHRECVEANKNGELRFLNPWMLGRSKDRIIAQLIRCKKYCMRWNLVLNLDAFKRLYSLYLSQPKINTEANRTYSFGSGWSTTVLVKAGQNVWQAIACLFKQMPGWQNDMDPHGYIASGEDTFVVNHPNEAGVSILQALSPTGEDSTLDLDNFFQTIEEIEQLPLDPDVPF
jgi:hypothetical protein